MPLFRTEPEENGLLAINMSLLRIETLTLFCSRFDYFCKWLFSLSEGQLRSDKLKLIGHSEYGEL